MGEYHACDRKLVRLVSCTRIFSTAGFTRTFLFALQLQARVLGSEPLGHVHLHARGEDIDGHLHGFAMELVAVLLENICLVPVLLVLHHSREKWHISSIKLRLGNMTGSPCTVTCVHGLDRLACTSKQEKIKAWKSCTLFLFVGW